MTNETWLRHIAGLALVLCCCWRGQALADEPVRPAAARPNILIILADDMGFSDIGCYGGEIATPNIDSLAAEGIRYTQFYNTARCWPTRSAILTGYYPQQIHMDPPQGPLPLWTRVLPHYLKPQGYRCYHSGKWHLFGAPQVVANGGFDHSYVLHDHDRYFAPKNHMEDDQPLPPVKPGSDFYTTTNIADHAIKYLKEHAEQHKSEPFFQYLAFTSPHYPLQAPAEDVARYARRYGVGWDAIRKERWERLKKLDIVTCGLAAREPAFMPRGFKQSFLNSLGSGEIEHPVAWSDLTKSQQKFQASKMAVHAAMVDRMDREIGRVLAQVRAMGALDNTVVFFLSDNGADASINVRGDGNDQAAPPGSAPTFRCIGPGWASASNSPFKLHKMWVHEGGISTPLVVHWPKGITAHGELRHQVGHVTDLVPTLLELSGGKATPKWHGEAAPALPGRSLVASFASDKPAPRDPLYFKHEGNRGLREGNWKIVSSRENGGTWELYDLATDRCEQVDLATKQPKRVEAMAATWKALDEKFAREAGPPLGPKIKPPGRGKKAAKQQSGAAWESSN